jgi:hypothetical protein
MLVFGIYLTVLGLVLLVSPGAIPQMLGIADVSEIWLRVLSTPVLALAFFFFQAVRTESKQFARWTVMARIGVFILYLGMVLLQLLPPVLILIGIVDLLGAGWTAYALRSESS